MKKVINVEPGEVFKMLAEGKDLYCVCTDSDQLFNLNYETVSSIMDKLRNKYCALFIVEEGAET